MKPCLLIGYFSAASEISQFKPDCIKARFTGKLLLGRQVLWPQGPRPGKLPWGKGEGRKRKREGGAQREGEGKF